MLQVKDQQSSAGEREVVCERRGHLGGFWEDMNRILRARNEAKGGLGQR